MAQSPEYPDLRWVPPKSWTNANRTSVQLIVIHTTEGSAHDRSAEDGAAYDARRTDGTSAHYFVDSDSIVQCVRTADQAHTARSQGNRRGIQYELCGRAGWTAETWSNDYCQQMLARAARQCARDARKWNIPARHLTVAQVAAGERGFCSHWDITRAFPADGGSHTDPGPNFPWSFFLDLVRDELDGDEMNPAQEAKLTEALTLLRRLPGAVDALPQAVWDHREPDPATDGTTDRRMGGDMRMMDYRAKTRQDALLTAITGAASADQARDRQLAETLQALPGAVATELADEGGVDGQVVTAAVERALERLRIVAAKDLS